MQCRLICEKPEEIEYTLSMTMKAKDFEAFREQLSSKWPSSELVRQINSLLSQARKIYWPQSGDAA